MTPFLLLSFAMALLTVTWLTRPLWRRAAAPTRFDATQPVPHAARPLTMIGGLAALVLAVAGIGYTLVGLPEHTGRGPSTTTAPLAPPRRDAQAPIDLALAQAESRVTTMIDSLDDRLRAHPDDADGWHTLARSYAALGHHAKAIEAFRTALRLRPDDSTWLAEYAFSAAVRDPNAASGEPARLVERALRLDPTNPKALALAGTLALDRKDYRAAVGHWEQLAQTEPPDSVVGKQLKFSILQARQLAGTQSGLMPASALAPAPGNNLAGPTQVGGTLTLAPALLARTSPNDTVFVFARAGNGPRMPLAVLRKQVKDLPLRFTLDDSLAVSPSATLSGAGSVIVGARITRGGNAVARDGDLQGQLPAMAPGRSDLKLEINEVVRLR